MAGLAGHIGNQTETAVIALVAGETKAVVIASWMAVQCGYRGKSLKRYFLLRLFWCSPLFHEKFAAMMHKRPVYRTFEVYLAGAAVAVLAHKVGGLAPSAALGAGFLVAASAFAAVFGKAFWRQREHMAAVLASGRNIDFSLAK